MTVWKDKTRGWRYKFQRNGRVYREEGFKTKSAAQLAEANELKKVERLKRKTHTTSFQELVTMYLDHCAHRMQQNTVRQKSFVFRSFITFMGQDPDITFISTKTIGDFLNRQAADRGKKAANRDLKELNAAFNWALENQITTVNPVRPIERYAEDPYVPYVPPPEDLDRVRMAAARDERDYFEVLYHTAARRIEAARLTWNDVNFEQAWVRLYTRKRRGGELEPDFIPMNKDLKGILLSRWSQRDKKDPHVFQFNIDELAHMMPRLCKKAGVKPFGFHAIRHHVASLINDSGKAGIKGVQKFLRHKRQSTTENYLHMIDPQLEQTIKILESGNKSVTEGLKEKKEK